MTSEQENTTPASGDRGVFGNLPSERPGVRSPRRGQGKGAKATKASQPKSARRAPAAGRSAEPRSSAAPKAPPPPPPTREQAPRGPAPQAEAPESDSGRGSVEEVAWAGITVAAEAATLGVRLVSRALEAVRERR